MSDRTKPTTRTRNLLLAAVALTAALAGTLSSLPAEVNATGAQPAAKAKKSYFTPIPGAPMAPVNPDPIDRPGDNRPNIVLISSDDQRADEMRFMPKTRALLADGLRFEQALTPHPLCCPARAEILSGQYAQNNGVKTNFAPEGGYAAFDADHQIGTWLNASGYNTAFLGKPMNGYGLEDGVDPGWTIWDATSHGYADYYDFTQIRNDGKHNVDDVYYTDYLAEQGVQAINAMASHEAPFFMWVSHFGPHSASEKGETGNGEDGKQPPLLAARHQAKYGASSAYARRTDSGLKPVYDYAEEILSSGAFNEDDVSDKPNFIAKQTKTSQDKLREFVYARAGALAAVDDAVAEYLTTLRDLGELDNTYVFFVTDNGYQLGEHRFFGKVMPYEENLRMPMLVSGPGVIKGRTNQIATTVDLAATFVDIAGARVDRVLDGVSVLPMLEGNRNFDPHGNTVLIQGGAVKSENGKTGWLYRGVRTQRYTYAGYYDGFEELYDRERDPNQMRNVADKPAYKNVLAELRKRTLALKDCSGADECNHRFGEEPQPRG